MNQKPKATLTLAERRYFDRMDRIMDAVYEGVDDGDMIAPLVYALELLADFLGSERTPALLVAARRALDGIERYPPEYDGGVADDAPFDIDAPVGADDVRRVVAAARERGGQISLDDALRLLTRRPAAQQRAVDDAIARIEQRPTPLRSEVGASVADVLKALIRESVTVH